MDRMYVKNALEMLENEKAIHDKKYADNDKHANCLPNFERAIDKLKAELVRLDSPDRR
ncbi:MAG TPA: hypothetical protein V6C72_00895 [Chroococcales cyanobacterium]